MIKSTLGHLVVMGAAFRQLPLPDCLVNLGMSA